LDLPIGGFDARQQLRPDDQRNYLQKWRFLIPEYEAVKAGRSVAFRRVGDFYWHHGTCSQTFRKYYNRYLGSGAEADLLPQRRGPKWRERREPEGIEAEIVACRRRGMNRYEMRAAMREEKPRIIKDKLAELGHVDLHQLPRDMFLAPPLATAYVVSLLDSCSRLAWAEVVAYKKALLVMFRTLKMINALNVTYGLVFAEILSDNGAEFASRNRPDEHPFEAMLLELGIRHRYTRPYRPQINGKIERFWRTLDDDVIDGATFDNLDHFANELFEYLVYYNNHRPHQALAGKTPKDFAEAKANPNQSAN
jgi:transposase InsO family protein